MIQIQRENDCGVCAVANALEVSWTYAADIVFNENWSNKLRFNTKTRQIANALNIQDHKLIRVKEWHDIPDHSIVKVINSAQGGTGNWHWVVWRDGLVWDSNHSVPIAPHRYNHRLVSYLGKAS